MNFRGTLGGRAIGGLVFVATTLLVVTLLVLQSQGAFRHKIRIHTTMGSVGDGLPVGSDVKFRGVLVGRVSEVDAAPGKFVVNLELKPEFQGAIPAAVEARVVPSNLFGAPAVELTQTGPERPALKDGMSVPANAKANVQMQTVFQKVYDVLVVVEPAKLNLTLGAIADALRGNGKRIGTMIDSSAAYLVELNRHADVFQRDLSLLASTLATVSKSAPDLMAAAENSVALAKAVVDTRNGLRTLLTAGIDVADSAGRFLDENGQRIIRFLDVSERVTEIIAPVSGGISASLISLGNFADVAEGALGPGGARLDLWITTADFPTYTSADCPRYGTVAGPNCSRGRVAPPTHAAAPRYGGTVDSVGSPEEKELMEQLFPDADVVAVSADLVSLVLGPVLRGRTVVAR